MAPQGHVTKRLETVWCQKQGHTFAGVGNCKRMFLQPEEVERANLETAKAGQGAIA